MAPIEHPATTVGIIPFSSNTSNTPMWEKPRAEPLPRAIPIFILLPNFLLNRLCNTFGGLIFKANQSRLIKLEIEFRRYKITYRKFVIYVSSCLNSFLELLFKDNF